MRHSKRGNGACPPLPAVCAAFGAGVFLGLIGGFRLLLLLLAVGLILLGCSRRG